MNAAFDTLNASKRLRDAGVEERAADAIVELVRYSTGFPDISGLATKTDLADMATRADIADMATKADLADMATKTDLADMATKGDVADLAATTTSSIADLAATTKADLQVVKTDLLLVKAEISISEHRIRAELHDQLRIQAFALVGSMTAVVGLATAIIKLFP